MPLKPKGVGKKPSTVYVRWCDTCKCHTALQTTCIVCSNPTVESKHPACKACDASGRNSKRGLCFICSGTGKADTPHPMRKLG